MEQETNTQDYVLPLKPVAGLPHAGSCDPRTILADDLWKLLWKHELSVYSRVIGTFLQNVPATQILNYIMFMGVTMGYQLNMLAEKFPDDPVAQNNLAQMERFVKQAHEFVASCDKEGMFTNITPGTILILCPPLLEPDEIDTIKKLIQTPKFEKVN
jgi:hypothetical protein